MKQIILLLLSACISLPSLAQEETIRVGQSNLEAGDTIVFLGDSITHQRLYTQYVEDFFITRFPNVPLRFHNAGIGGDRAWDALQRLERDVLSKKPKLVTILLGMNDGSYRGFDHEVFGTYEADMTELLERLENAGTEVSPITPTMFDPVAAQTNKRRPRDEVTLRQYNAVLAFYGTWLRGEADRRSMTSIDMFAPLNQLTRLARQDKADFTFIPDGVHPDAAGQMIMAHAWLHDLGMQGSVSNIVLLPMSKGKRRARVSGGAVEALKVDEDSIEFTFIAESLPWVTPENTEAATKMLRLDHRFSREGFQVHGLSPGRYTLSIDDTEIGTFTNLQLAAHIELQRFPSTPQSVQAARVIEMNRNRNETTIKDLRGHWYVSRNLARQKRTLESVEDQAQREKLERNIASAEKKMEGFEETLLELEAKAAEELEEIYEAAKPVPHRYVLTKAD